MRNDSAIYRSHDGNLAGYTTPRRFGYITNLPGDLWEMTKSPFRRENVTGLSVVAASSAILIWQDQHLIDGAGQLGKAMHLDYQRNTSDYDGFPSGHLATMMATVTVLAENYPEKKWIRPVGYSLMAITSFAMTNNKVHWTGDYPLALALGYVAGKITVKMHKRKQYKTVQ